MKKLIDERCVCDQTWCELDEEAAEDEEYLLDPSALGGLSMLPFLKTYKQLLMQTGGEGTPSGGLSGSEGNRKMDLGADDEGQIGVIHRRPAVQCALECGVLHSRCFMHGWCLDDIWRGSWGGVVAGSWWRA